MLGKDHINISIAFILPFLIPLFFLDTGDILLMVVFLFSVFIGSLIPDSDCKGKATISYKFPIVDTFMRVVVGKVIIYGFNHLISHKKIETEFKVGDEHRGVMHSPIGVLFSSLILIIPIIIFGLVFKMFDFFVLLAIFFGLIIGQLFHLFEDSCTISGINWLFPFKKAELKGKIYTFSKDPERKDIRPTIYAWILHFLTALLVVGYIFELINHVNIFLILFLILLFEIAALFVMFKLSQSSSAIWMVKRETFRNVNKYKRRMSRNLEGF